jgi:hypothetical protein
MQPAEFSGFFIVGWVMIKRLSTAQHHWSAETKTQNCQVQTTLFPALVQVKH